MKHNGTLLESRCSGTAVDQKIREAAARHPQSILARLVGGEPDQPPAKQLHPAIERGDTLARSILAETDADLALVGRNRGRLAQLADTLVVVDSPHYGRTEDAHMLICHMICHAFMELGGQIVPTTAAGGNPPVPAVKPRV